MPSQSPPFFPPGLCCRFHRTSAPWRSQRTSASWLDHGLPVLVVRRYPRTASRATIGNGSIPTDDGPAGPSTPSPSRGAVRLFVISVTGMPTTESSLDA